MPAQGALFGTAYTSTWKPPREFPRLDSAEAIAIDLETYDPELKSCGPGWGRGVGHIAGIAVGVPDGQRWYFPMRHEVGAEDNLSPESVLAWARHEFSRSKQPKVGANLIYDLGWLAEEGMHVQGELCDVQYAEALLDEHMPSYSLDDLAVKHLGEHKVDDALYEWCRQTYGGPKGRPQAANIYRAPPALVGPYAEGDVDLPLRIWAKQAPRLRGEHLMSLYRMEASLIPMLLKMRQRGVRVDLDRAERARTYLRNRVQEQVAKIKALTGVDVNINAPASVAPAMDALGIAYPKTATGMPSFRAEFLEHLPSELGQLLRAARKYDKAGTTFIDGYILDKAIKGRVHSTFHPLRAEGKGTIVGRFSSTDPNLENIPSRDPELGPLLRSLWLPEEGETWTVYDFSQIQFRIMVHYAMGQGADEARARYLADPTTDYHDMTQALITETTGIELKRKQVKNINFGLAFTMGVDKLAASLGIPAAEAKPLLDAYHRGLPFMRTTSEEVAKVAQERGYIRGILNRRHRFVYWEPKKWELRKQVKLSTDPEEVARAIAELTGEPTSIHRVQRAFTHLGLNRLAQDGEGSHVKTALVKCHKAGLFNVVGYPLNIVHDDVNLSNAGTPEAEEALAEIKHIFETAVEWKVPMRVERQEGADWGAVK